MKHTAMRNMELQRRRRGDYGHSVERSSIGLQSEVIRAILLDLRCHSRDLVEPRLGQIDRPHLVPAQPEGLVEPVLAGLLQWPPRA